MKVWKLLTGAQDIRAMVPLSEMFGYATVLRSRTQGRGNYIQWNLITMKKYQRVFKNK